MHRLFWALLILAGFAILLRMDWVYYLIYVVGGVWAVSHWWVRRSLSRLTVERRMLERAFVGESLDVKLVFKNQSWLPIPWLQVREQAPIELKSQPNYSIVLSIGSRSHGEYRYDFACKKRGFYPVGPLVLKTGDLFGFISASWQETVTTNVIVYPKMLSLQELGLPSRSPFGTLSSRQRLFEDPARIAGVRAYASGDSMRRIHWKASAHEDSLLVKKFQPAIALNVTIVLDLNRNAYPDRGALGYSEWAIVVAASMAGYVTGQRQPVGLLTNGLDPFSEATAAPVPAHHGAGQLMEILALLARIQPHRTDETLMSWLPAKIADLAWGTTLIVVTPQLDRDALWALHSAYRRGSNVLVLVCAPQPDFDGIQAAAGRLGVTVERTVWESELKALGSEPA